MAVQAKLRPVERGEYRALGALGLTAMHSILLLNTDDRPFDTEAIERILKTEADFSDVRSNTTGAAIESHFGKSEEWIIVRLSAKLSRISLSGTTDTTLRAALILQARLDRPLRIVDTDYSFDLILADSGSIEELRAAIDAAQAS
jgi:hypothetical protein